MHEKTSRQACVLVEFSWGSNTARYTSFDDRVTAISLLWQPRPEMSVRQTSDFDGGTSSSKFSITLPRHLPPADTAARPFRHAPISVRIYECDPSTSEFRQIFGGDVQRVEASSKNADGSVEFTCVGPKDRLSRIPLGLAAVSSCQNAFGDRLCGFDLGSAKFNGTVSAVRVDGLNNRISMTFSGSPNLSDSWLAFGKVEYDGLAIPIRRVDSSTSSSAVLDLFETPPPEWAGETATVSPGCPKNIGGCRARGREESFLAVGIAASSFNPVVSLPRK